MSLSHAFARCRPPRTIHLAWALLALLAGLLQPSAPAAAHAQLEESDPAANAILATAPTSITLRFSERLERSASGAVLYNQTGQAVDGAAPRFVDDPYAMVVDIPAGLANGTYALLWNNLSMDDGHTAQGYVPFTIGSEADVRTVVPPAATATDAGPPEWLRAGARWLALLGLAAAVAVWPVWLWVLRPAISPAWQLGPTLTRRVRGLTVGAVALALLGSLAALLVQAAGVRGAGGFLDGLRTTVTDTRFGTLWLIRIGLFLVYGAVLMGAAWWWPWRRPAAALGALAVGALLPLPFSLIAHAAAQPAGRAVAVAADVLHLLAASLWAGGLLVLVGALTPSLRDLTPAGRRAVLGRAIPRFSTLALVAWGVMGLTGLYSAWLHVGNLDALRQTAYGQSLLLKLLLLTPMLGLAGFNLLLVTRRLRRAEAEPAQTAWSARFVTAIVAESLLVLLVFFVVGRLTSQPPARDVLARQDDRLAIPLAADGQLATLFITPGTVGPNHYRLELGSGHDHGSGRSAAPVEAVLRVQHPDRDTGQKEIDLVQAAGTAYEAHGSELAIAGDWEIEAIVRQSGQADWRAAVTEPIGTEGTGVDLPGPPPRFGPAGVAGLLLVVAGIATVVFGLRAGRSPLRKEAAGLGTAALGIGAVLLLQARLAPGEAEGAAESALAAPDPAAVTRGASLFAANCVACHGPGGKGDGPRAAALERPPADLTAPHARSHRDEDYAYWIANGIPASGMPAFGETLGDDRIADVVAYVRSLQGPDARQALDVPGAEECRVEPRTLDGLRALAADPGAAPPDPAPPAVASPSPAPAAEPADAETLAGITAVARELVACSNAGDQLRRLALFSDANVRAGFPDGPDEVFARTAAAPVPVPDGERVALLGVTDARRLGPDRAIARVGIDNPGAHSHGPGRAAQHEQATLVFVRNGDGWLIDDVQR